MNISRDSTDSELRQVMLCLNKHIDDHDAAIEERTFNTGIRPRIDLDALKDRAEAIATRNRIVNELRRREVAKAAATYRPPRKRVFA